MKPAVVAKNQMRKRIVFIFAIAVLLNFGWEMVAGLLYGPMHWLECLIASVADGLMTLIIVFAGAGFFGGLAWTDSPGVKGYALVIVLGGTMAAAVELIGVYHFHLWSYKHEMPIIFGIGVAPLLQMTCLPALTFALVKRAFR